MPKLNVGVFSHDLYPIKGGQGKHIYELNKQNNKFKEVNYFLFSPMKNNLNNHTTIFPNSNDKQFKNIGFSVQLNFHLKEFIEKYSLDLVHLHGGPGGIFLFKKPSVPVIFTSHHTYWQQANYIKKQKWKQVFFPLEKVSYQNADSIISVSKSTREILVTRYQQKEDKITVIPNGITIPKGSSGKYRVKNRELIYVGRLDFRKGIHFLLNAMKIVNQRDPDIKLHVVGTGKSLQSLKQIAKKNKLNVVFHGYLSETEMKNLYETVSIQIVPSIFEGFGIAVLEAMANRVSVIATDVSGINELIENNASGVLVDYGDEFALSEAINNLVNDPIRQDNLVENGYKSLKKYQWEDIYYSTIREYEKFKQI